VRPAWSSRWPASCTRWTGSGRSFAFEPFDIVARELTVVGVNSVRHTFGRAARLLAAGALPVNLLHESPLPLAATAQALERSRRGAGLKTRVQLRGDAS